MMATIVGVILLVLLVIAATNLPEIFEEKLKAKRQRRPHMAIVSAWVSSSRASAWSVKDIQVASWPQEDRTSNRLPYSA